jgi:hypothetical protein
MDVRVVDRAPKAGTLDRETLRARAEAQGVELVASRRVDGLVRLLQRDYPGASFDDVADAVSDGVAAFYRRALTTPVAEPGGYVYGTARRILANDAARQEITQSLDDDPRGLKKKATGDRQDWSRALEIVLAIVHDWPTSNVRVVTELVVQAAAEGIQLSDADIAEAMRQMGLELSQNSVRVWRHRGLDRLRTEVAVRGVDLDDLAEELTAAGL